MLRRPIKIVRNAWRRYVDNELPKICYKSRFLSNLYYFLFCAEFSREHQAVLCGRVKHIEDARKYKANYFLLVRNIHRLEKGLLMRPRKEIFATQYIAETIDSFSNIWTSSAYDHKSHPQQKWFKDVLAEYFDKSGGDHPIVVKQKKRFTKIINGYHSSNESVSHIPYHRDLENRVNITFEEFYRLNRQRRSVRWFLPKSVPRELIDKAILAACQAPSACNRQPFEFKIFDEPSLVKEVINFPMGTRGYGHSVPVVVVVVGNLDAYQFERDRHIIYIDGALASMSFMLALETVGLSSCPINWPDIEAREMEMEKFLKLKKYQRPIMCIGLGYPDPDGKVAFSEKRGLDQVRGYNL